MNPTLANPDDDPFLWLEEIDGEKALAWVDAETAQTLRRFGGPAFERDRDILAQMFDRRDRIPFVTRRGGEVYNFWVDAANKRGLWRRAPWQAYRDGEPDWEILLDLDALAAEEGEDWVWAGSTMRPGERNCALLALSRGGGDACVLREYDLSGKAFVAGGFVAPEAKQSADWVDGDVLLIGSAYGDATRSGYARTVKLWRRGEPFEAARVVFEGDAENMAVGGGLDRSVEPPRWWFARRFSFFAHDLWLGEREPRARIDAPTDADKHLDRDWLLLILRTPWTREATTYPAGALLIASLSRALAGDAEYTVLFAPAERSALDGFVWIGETLVLATSDNLAQRFEALTHEAHGWRRRALAGAPDIGVLGVNGLDAFDREANGEALIFTQDPLTPMTMSLVDVSRDAAPAVIKRMPELFDASGLVISRHEAIAQDGERIPYVQVGPAASDGAARVYMTGYGGFQIAERPLYRGDLGKLWLERGGTGIVANIRGGGEFGPRWHKAGMREGKRVAQDDFAAVAADLVARGVTRPKRIAAEGGSNGGLLVANMLTRHPEKFGALFCTIPLIDMRRYTKLLAGASWTEEYGDPDNSADWDFLQHISAYHLAEPGRPYPPILIATSRRDDRVHPGHARKFAAKLQALGYPAHFYEPAAGGHGYGNDNFQRAGFTALGLDFLWETISNAGS